MEFSDKLQKLRKENGLTQEQLAEKLYVSRTAISKWESGRGYPNIESLKAISKEFGVSIDELLSGDELIDACEKDSVKKINQAKAIVFCCVDMMAVLMCILPLFKEAGKDRIYSVSLFSLTSGKSYVNIIFWILMIVSVAYGVIHYGMIARRKVEDGKRLRTGSLLISAFTVVCFILAQEPYAAVFVFFLLMIKVILLINRA